MAKCKSLARSNQGQVLGGGGYSLSVKAFSYYIAIGIDLSTQNQKSNWWLSTYKNAAKWDKTFLIFFLLDQVPAHCH